MGGVIVAAGFDQLELPRVNRELSFVHHMEKRCVLQNSINCNIRLATLEDVEAIIEIGRSTFARAYGAIVLPSDMESYLAKVFDSELIRSEILSLSVSYYLTESESNILAYAKLVETSKPEYLVDANVAELVRLYVVPEVYGKGIGRLLLNTVRQEVIASGYSGWWLRVWEKNEGAIRFYERNNFRRVGREPYLIGVTANPVVLMFESFE
ncbi:protease synthase and sporulation negative regulatory protein PAI 1 [Mariprofundus micogutta]|uniref:Protease synthase and sporulation negative regulatory protein PAI 1 n=1 Tax=Mariprofundus micogutta TaxID=1921010 RepID=A0A1L8CMZ2_9PROT|nr:GNAT family N-acetyltransferase [Mariprofundus micogutta]GAV20286.1 protease synthase and sporulation negative regulatory protein PAI 1 [Mariprofundus micogutta]